MAATTVPEGHNKYNMIHFPVSVLTTEHEGAHCERSGLPLPIRSEISRGDAAEVSSSRLSHSNLWLIQVN